MFAPRTGRYVAVGGAALLLVGLLWAARVLPRTYALAALLSVGALIWVFFAWFLRDPERTPGPDIVSAADGRVLFVDELENVLRISVFMNVTDVHVNRLPLTARFDRIDDAGTGFLPAYLASSSHNVRRHYSLSSSIGTVEVIQMTGAIARRLVSFVRVGESRAKGDRFGMIILGSRVDVLLPADRVEATVNPGDRVTAGVTRIAREKK
ncbi:MAG: phosphatidylserine decarboxylase [Candidatus Lutacidiplasmatales archaeon]